ncbi:MAG: winged helix-turn-helix domain-containing protein [Xanthomonadales bacterium]|nr:winged helix-turn-helix domain-containing protein [Xanthomonadales bacterium]
MTDFHIDDLRIDPLRRRVYRGDVEVELSRLSFEVFMALAREAPDPVSPRTLIERVWRGEAQTETLETEIVRLRKSLEDDPGRPRYVEAIPGAGYRLIPSIRRSKTGAVGRRWLIGGVIVVIALILLALIVGVVNWIATGPPT